MPGHKRMQRGTSSRNNETLAHHEGDVQKKTGAHLIPIHLTQDASVGNTLLPLAPCADPPASFFREEERNLNEIRTMAAMSAHLQHGMNCVMGNREMA